MSSLFSKMISTLVRFKLAINVVVDECEHSIDDHTAENSEGQDFGL